MNTNFAEQHLHLMKNPSIENRQKTAELFLENPSLFPQLIYLTFKTTQKNSIKAAWILEWICTHHHVEWLFPHLNIFCKHISKVQFDSAIRPCAKICAQIAEIYAMKQSSSIKKIITQSYQDQLITTAFDWLISPQKIAVRAYSMTALYYFGLEKKWIHTELEHLIRTKIIFESKGCKARGNILLKWIEKHAKSSS